jgi:hypothetical protein
MEISRRWIRSNGKRFRSTDTTDTTKDTTTNTTTNTTKDHTTESTTERNKKINSSWTSFKLRKLSPVFSREPSIRRVSLILLNALMIWSTS